MTLTERALHEAGPPKASAIRRPALSPVRTSAPFAVVSSVKSEGKHGGNFEARWWSYARWAEGVAVSIPAGAAASTYAVESDSWP